MNALLLLALELVVSLAASLVVLRVLAVPLSGALGRICPDAESASFWVSYARVMLVIGPMVLVLLADLLTRFYAPVDGFRLALLAALIGLLFGMNLLGARVGRYVADPEPVGRAP